MLILIINLKRNSCYEECDLKNCSKFDPTQLIKHNLTLVDNNITTGINWKYISNGVSGGGGGGSGSNVGVSDNKSYAATIRNINYAADNTNYNDMNISNHDFINLKTKDDNDDNSFEEGNVHIYKAFVCFFFLHKKTATQRLNIEQVSVGCVCLSEGKEFLTCLVQVICTCV